MLLKDSISFILASHHDKYDQKREFVETFDLCMHSDFLHMIQAYFAHTHNEMSIKKSILQYQSHLKTFKLMIMMRYLLL